MYNLLMEIDAITGSLVISVLVVCYFAVKLISAWQDKVDSDIAADGGLDSDSMDIQTQVDSHEHRLDYIETNYIQSGSINTYDNTDRNKRENK